jgi:hypothetical protein
VEELPGATADRETIAEALNEQVRPLVHQLSSAPSLHASAVRTPDGIVAFLGSTMAGKSTLAALLAREWPLVADDHLPIRVEDGLPVAYPSTSWVRLRTPSAAGLRAEGPTRYGKTIVSAEASEEPGLLVCVYLVGEISSSVEIRPVSRRDAALAIAAQLHRLDPSDAALLTAELDFLQALAEKVTVRSLRYPRRFDVGQELVRAISADLATVVTSAQVR